MAPEMKFGRLEGPKTYTSSVDIFSLGLLLVELIMPIKTEDDPTFKARLFWKFGNRFNSNVAEENKLDATGLLDAVSQIVKELSPEYREMVISMIQDDPEKRMTWKEFFEHPIIKSMPDLNRLLIGEAP